MSKLRYHIAVMAAKFSKVIIRLSGRNGTHTPGVVARNAGEGRQEGSQQPDRFEYRAGLCDKPVEQRQLAWQMPRGRNCI